MRVYGVHGVCVRMCVQGAFVCAIGGCLQWVVVVVKALGCDVCSLSV